MSFNDLKNKLLQAGLVDEDQVRASEEKARKERQRRQQQKKRKPGRPSGPPAPREQRLSPEELAAAEALKAEKERRRALEKERQANRERALREKAMAEDIRRVAEYLRIEEPGEVVFFFQDRKNRLQRLMVSESLQTRLESGEAAVIEHPLPHAIEHAVVNREGAEAVLKINPKAVRFYNRSPEERYGSSEG